MGTPGEESLLRRMVRDLEARREAIGRLGGEDRIKKQHERGKLTCRERLARFYDDGVFLEPGAHGTQRGLSSGRHPGGPPRAHRRAAGPEDTPRPTVASRVSRLTDDGPT